MLDIEAVGKHADLVTANRIHQCSILLVMGTGDACLSSAVTLADERLLLNIRQRDK